MAEPPRGGRLGVRRMDKVRTVVPAPANDPLHRRAYVVGIVVNG